MGKRRKKFDPTAVVGVLITLTCILGGLLLEKGELGDVAQVTSGLIVLGGTLGAVVVSTPIAALRSALRRLPSVLSSSLPEPAALLETIVSLSHEFRRAGIKGLESTLEKLDYPFLKKAMLLIVDDYEAEEIRAVLEADTVISEQHAGEDARVFETAGGYAPTIGIIGAVLGLMQVMKHLDNITDVGRGIAIAFVATVYGVSLANLALLPVANKIRSCARQESRIREMVVEGAAIIQQGKNPRLIRMSLEPYLSDKQRASGSKSAPVELRERVANYR